MTEIFDISASFLLMFRATQAYARYWTSQSHVHSFFADIRDFVMVLTIFVGQRDDGDEPLFWIKSAKDVHTHRRKGSSYSFDENEPVQGEREIRVNAIRLCLALAISYKMQTRIMLRGYMHGHVTGETKWALDWDRFRLRQLLLEEEFQIIDEALAIEENDLHMAGADLESFVEQFRTDVDGSGPPRDWPSMWSVSTEPHARSSVVLVFLLRELLICNMNDSVNSKPWGVRERLVPMLWDYLESMQDSIEMSMQIITTPLPFPLNSLCKTMIAIYLLSLVFSVDASLGFFGAVVIPGMAVISILGVAAISDELENPFGDDPNDIDLTEAMHSFETEVMEMLILMGDYHGRSAFVWRRMPSYITHDTNHPIKRHLVLRRLAAEEVVPPPR